jgi:hypothetical protein
LRVIPAASAEPPGKETARSARAAQKAFQAACNDNDRVAARRHLLEWVRAQWPGDSPQGLNALASRLNNDRAAQLVRQLDRACYGEGEWQGGELARTLIELPTAEVIAKRSGELAGLYP